MASADGSDTLNRVRELKSTPDAGQVSVTATAAEGVITVAVSDIGIAPEDQAAIFEELRQVGRDDVRKQEGAGLGLTLAKKFVELHGGRRVGQGSTFTFTLRRSRPGRQVRGTSYSAAGHRRPGPARPVIETRARYAAEGLERVEVAAEEGGHVRAAHEPQVEGPRPGEHRHEGPGPLPLAAWREKREPSEVDCTAAFRMV